MKGSAVACPVCGKGHRNAQGLGGHLAHSKDQDHTAYRTTGRLPAVPLAVPAAPAAPAAHTAPDGQAAPVVMPSDPFSAEGIMWTFDRLNDYLAARRERRRAHAAQASPSAPETPAQDEAAGDDYWRKLLGNAYVPPKKEDPHGP